MENKPNGIGRLLLRTLLFVPLLFGMFLAWLGANIGVPIVDWAKSRIAALKN